MKVLRLRIGDSVELVDGTGKLQTSQVSTLDKTCATVWCPTKFPVQPPSSAARHIGRLCWYIAVVSHVVLVQVASIEAVRHIPWSGPRLELVVACGGLKGGRSDWLIEKATELGAFSIIPLLTANSAQLGGGAAAQKSKSRVKDDHPQSGRLARWQRVATAGMKQSLRTHELQIAQPWQTDDLISCISSGAQALVGAEGGCDVLEALQCMLPLPTVRPST